jgi:hypothetical protein
MGDSTRPLTQGFSRVLVIWHYLRVRALGIQNTTGVSCIHERHSSNSGLVCSTQRLIGSSLSQPIPQLIFTNLTRGGFGQLTKHHFLGAFEPGQ